MIEFKAKQTGTMARRLRRDVRGLAAIEFALIAGFLSVSVLNVADVAVFLFDKLQVNNATQMGAQAAWATCDLNHVPATTRCPTMNAAVTTAVQSTSLGNAVTVQAGYPAEGWYCVNSSGTLQYMADYANPPADCTTAGVPLGEPDDYVKIQTTYDYSPIFPGLSVASVFPAHIVSTSYVRLAG